MFICFCCLCGEETADTWTFLLSSVDLQRSFPHLVLNAETSEEREMVRWVPMVRQAVDFLELRLADQWQPAQQLEAPPTWKRGRWNEIFQRERTEGKERNWIKEIKD